MDSIKFRLNGEVMTLMHNGRRADPMDPYTIAAKQITSKRKKTPEDELALRRIDWESSLYMEDGVIGWPEQNVLGLLHAAAKKHRRGKDVLAGVWGTHSFFPLMYDGPTDLDELYTDAEQRFVDVRSCRVQSARVMRTRACFPAGWSLDVGYQFDPTIVSREDLVEWMHLAGAQIGLSDYRPRFGRFTCVEV